MRSYALALLLAGCVTRLDPHETIQPVQFRDFPELVALHRAVNAWNEAIPLLKAALVHEGGTWAVAREDLGGGRYGNTSRYTPLIRIDAALLAAHYPRAPLEHLTSTAMHEIAHALGPRRHLDGDAPDLLRGYHSGATCVDARTLALVLAERPELAPGAKATCP